MFDFEEIYIVIKIKRANKQNAQLQNFKFIKTYF